ncbi:MAG: alcohol dehydrogenase catalytic domain-containing protein [Phycisphaerales bacterium]|nr:alcohol dehydrogenase catalytic domain-containing protein [Phycisphaerales bacterium]
MRAVRIDSSGPRLVTLPAAPAPAPGSALVRIRRIALTAADAPPTALSPSATPSPPGFCFVGLVEQLNIDPAAPPAPPALRERLAALQSQRIVASPTITCGACDMCRAGLAPHCRERRLIGAPPPLGRDGALADTILLPIANLAPVPDSLDDEHAMLAPLVATAIHAAHLAARARFLTIIGPGPLGLLTAAAAVARNPAGGGAAGGAAGARYLVSTPAELAVCEKWSLKHRPISDAGRRHDQDAVIDCSGGLTTPGAASTNSVACALARPRATLILASASPHPAPTSPLDLAPALEHELIIHGCRAGGGGGGAGSLTEALALLAQGHFDTRALISRRIKLDDAPAALRSLASPDTLVISVEP